MTPRIGSFCVALVALVAAGCDTGTSENLGPSMTWGPASNTLYSGGGDGDIVGAWIVTGGTNCAEYVGGGYQFASDGTYAILVPMSAEAVCTYAGGSWSWHGDELTLEIDGEEVTFPLEIDGDKATIVVPGQDGPVTCAFARDEGGPYPECLIIVD